MTQVRTKCLNGKPLLMQSHDQLVWKKGLKAIFFLSFHDFTYYAYTRVWVQPCICTCVSRWQNLCGGHRAIYRSWFSPSVWVTGIKLEFSWLAASPFTLWAVSPVWEKYFSSISIQHLFIARSCCGNHSIENPGYPPPSPTSQFCQSVSMNRHRPQDLQRPM